MRLTASIFLITLTSLIARGQQNVFPDTFPRTKGVKAVVATRDCIECKPSTRNDIFAKYYFDSAGYNTQWYSLFENKKSGKQTYNYNNQKLISYQNNSTLVSTSTEGNFGMMWDSTKLTNEVQYQYKGEQLVSVQWIDGESKRISFDITYSYDNEGRLQKETIKNYPDPNSFGLFEPNSAKLVEDPDAKRYVVNNKDYEYNGDTTIVKFYKEGVLTGIETNLHNVDGLITKSTLHDTSGNMMKQLINTYNSSNQLIQRELTDTGYDGFGNAYDYQDFEKETYEYDSKGNLTAKSSYSGGRKLIEERFQYKR